MVSVALSEPFGGLPLDSWLEPEPPLEPWEPVWLEELFCVLDDSEEFWDEFFFFGS